MRFGYVIVAYCLSAEESCVEDFAFQAATIMRPFASDADQ